MTDPVTIGLPSKGRLKEASLDVFASVGLTVELPADPRSYRGKIPALPGVEIMFLSASEIARDVAAGRVHLGVTGL
ncbi:MAG: ATP phosphoribosyltransferase, partial [Pseudomonadota bacterium]